MNFSQPLILLGLLVLVPLLWKIRSRPATLLRGLALVLLLLALAGPKLGSHISENHIYFALDLSGSISRPREELFKLIDSLMVEREHVHYGLILFGAEAAIDQGFTTKLAPPYTHTIVPPEGTDIAAALKLALAGFPQESGKEIVLLSDGLPTQGDLQEQLARAVREGVRVSVLPLYPQGAEAWLEELSLPQEVLEGAEFPVKLSIGALEAMEVRLLLYRDGRLLQAVELQLNKGENGFTLHDRLRGAGGRRYRAYLLADRDAILKNNSLEATVIVADGPPILLLQDEESEALAGLLEAAGYDYRRAAPAGFPGEPAALAPYRLVILDNIKLAQMGNQAVAALEGYVEGGGGLLVIQGRRAVEGLHETGLEKILPVSYEAREPAQAPSLALAFVLDRSSSMTGRKIQSLKEAAAASVEILDEKDLIGLLAFDTAYEWIVPLQLAEEKEKIYHRIAEIEANGGTDLLPALTEVFHRLNGVEARVKHIVVFSDGKTGNKLRFPKLVEQIKESKITLSAIAIGETAEAEFLGELAEQGGGRLYQVMDPQELPRVTLQETERAARQRWVTGEVEIIPGPYAHLLGEHGAIPDLEGYVVTYPKGASELALLSQREDPLVSFWNFGLGRVGVINTDLEGRWSAGWLKWEGLPGLFARIVGQALGHRRREGVDLTTELRGGSLEMVADIVDVAGRRWANLLQVRGVLSSTERPARELELKQVAPGRYRTAVEDLEPGSYLLSLVAKREGREVASQVEPVAVAYPEEYRRIGTDELLLEEIAATTGGEYLGNRLPEELLAGRPVRKYKELWPMGLLMALCTFVADLILRKLPWGKP